MLQNNQFFFHTVVE